MMLQALREIIGNGASCTLARALARRQSLRARHHRRVHRPGQAKSGLQRRDLTKLDTFFQQWLFGTTMPTITGGNFFSP